MSTGDNQDNSGPDTQNNKTQSNGFQKSKKQNSMVNHNTKRKPSKFISTLDVNNGQKLVFDQSNQNGNITDKNSQDNSIILLSQQSGQIKQDNNSSPFNQNENSQSNGNYNRQIRTQQRLNEEESFIESESELKVVSAENSESKMSSEIVDKNIDYATKAMCEIIKDRIALQEKLKLNQEMLIKSSFEDQIARQIQLADEALENNLKAEPIYEIKYKYEQGTDSPAWKKKQFGNKKVVEIVNDDDSDKSMSISSDSSYDENQNDDDNSKENLQLQEKLLSAADKIKIQTFKTIDVGRYPSLFKYKIYEGYLPESLSQTRDYFKFIHAQNIGNEAKSNEHMDKYLNKRIRTKFPEFIVQKNILRFDQNFECGNLDSAYLHRENSYNLLMKVDSNTKGNMYWFMFKVANFRIGQTYRFNILNFTRSIQHFYNSRMNIFTRAENMDSHIATPKYNDTTDEWRYDQCTNISFGQSELSQYFQLTFDYTFTLTDQGCYVYFSYARPYSYSNLLQDLNIAKEKLMRKSKDEKSPITPTFKVISKEEYQDYQQFENLYTSNLQLPLSSVQKVQPSITDNKLEEEGIRSKKTKGDLQQINIRKTGQRQLNSKKTKFENEFQDRNEMIQIDEGNDCNNFELVNDFLLYRQEVIAQSLGGLNVYQLTFTKRKNYGGIKYNRRQCLYIQARLHAAETHGSFVMSHIIQELTDNYMKYETLLSNYIIKVIPMVNPDGVALGNSRSSLAGVDLNRRWSNPVANIHPEIYFLKQSMKQTANTQKGISLFCDLHGHNKLKNCFFYGCNTAPKQGLLSWTKTRLFPKIFAQVEPLFDFNSCKFNQHQTKYNTARVVVWNDFEVTNSFTLETSMYSKLSINQETRKKGIDEQLFPNDFQSIGINLLKAIQQLFKVEQQLQKELQQTKGWLKKKMLDEFTGKTARQRVEEAILEDKQKELQKISKNGLSFEKEAQKKPPLAQRSSRAVGTGQNSVQVSFKIKRSQIDLGGEEIQSSKLKKNNKVSSRAHSFKSTVLPDLTKGDEIPNCLKEYFSENEVVSLIQEFDSPERVSKGKKKKNVHGDESDSNPSCDNFELMEINECFEEVLDNDQKKQLEKQREKKLEELQTMRIKPEEEEEKIIEENDQFNFVKKINTVVQNINTNKQDVQIRQKSIIAPTSQQIRLSAQSPKNILSLNDEHEKFKKSWIAEKEKIQQKYQTEELLFPITNDGRKKQNQSRGKSEDYRLLCAKLLEAKKKTANLVHQYNDVKGALEAGTTFLNQRNKVVDQETSKFPHCQPQLEQFKHSVQAQQQDYLRYSYNLEQTGKRANQNNSKNMSNYIDQYLLPVVNAKDPIQDLQLDKTNSAKKSRNKQDKDQLKTWQLGLQATKQETDYLAKSRETDNMQSQKLYSSGQQLVGQSLQFNNRGSINQRSSFAPAINQIQRETKPEENILQNITQYMSYQSPPHKGDIKKSFFVNEQHQTTSKKPRYDSKTLINNNLESELFPGQEKQKTITSKKFSTPKRTQHTMKNLFAGEGVEYNKIQSIALSPNAARRQNNLQFPNVRNSNALVHDQIQRPLQSPNYVHAGSVASVELSDDDFDNNDKFIQSGCRTTKPIQRGKQNYTIFRQDQLYKLNIVKTREQLPETNVIQQPIKADYNLINNELQLAPRNDQQPSLFFIKDGSKSENPKMRRKEGDFFQSIQKRGGENLLFQESREDQKRQNANEVDQRLQSPRTPAVQRGLKTGNDEGTAKRKTIISKYKQ